jgi:hypothetical protein
MGYPVKEISEAIVELPGTRGPLDISPLLHLSQGRVSQPASTSERKDSSETTEQLEEGPVEVGDELFPVDVFIDGIQSSFILTYLSGRPVRLTHVAAGAVTTYPDKQPDLLGLIENVELVYSCEDETWVKEMMREREVLGVPTHALPHSNPPEVETEGLKRVGALREKAEARLTEKMLTAGSIGVCVDGHLLNRSRDERVIGVIKTSDTKYLSDENQLWTLPFGWRSAAFRIPSPTGDRYSSYVRLQERTDASSWSFGLIRVEAFTPDVLDQAAALALAYRQDAGARDLRWDRHIAPIRVVEEVLRTRRPSVF